MPNLRLAVSAPHEAAGDTRRRVQGTFTYNDVNYRLYVTDPLVEEWALARRDGEMAIGEAALTVSLGEPFQGRAYKLIAAVITPRGAGRQ